MRLNKGLPAIRMFTQPSLGPLSPSEARKCAFPRMLTSMLIIVPGDKRPSSCDCMLGPDLTTMPPLRAPPMTIHCVDPSSSSSSSCLDARSSLGSSSSQLPKSWKSRCLRLGRSEGGSKDPVAKMLCWKCTFQSCSRLPTIVSAIIPQCVASFVRRTGHSNWSESMSQCDVWRVWEALPQKKGEQPTRGCSSRSSETDAAAPSASVGLSSLGDTERLVRFGGTTGAIGQSGGGTGNSGLGTA
mmetsp:Transcript_82304/g.176233  ORF Transcript_82304/g.176233 Transcript_82304/m.176233 type:complete len:242 (-) Transcript_82304:508-1233(-)